MLISFLEGCVPTVTSATVNTSASPPPQALAAHLADPSNMATATSPRNASCGVNADRGPGVRKNTGRCR